VLNWQKQVSPDASADCILVFRTAEEARRSAATCGILRNVSIPLGLSMEVLVDETRRIHGVVVTWAPKCYLTPEEKAMGR
jgi:hypothetical protein